MHDVAPIHHHSALETARTSAPGSWPELQFSRMLRACVVGYLATVGNPASAQAPVNAEDALHFPDDMQLAIKAEFGTLKARFDEYGDSPANGDLFDRSRFETLRKLLQEVPSNDREKNQRLLNSLTCWNSSIKAYRQDGQKLVEFGALLDSSLPWEHLAPEDLDMLSEARDLRMLTQQAWRRGDSSYRPQFLKLEEKMSDLTQTASMRDSAVWSKAWMGLAGGALAALGTVALASLFRHKRGGDRGKDDDDGGPRDPDPSPFRGGHHSPRFTLPKQPSRN